MTQPVRIPLLVVRRVYFDQFVSGEKTIEYRRHRPPFTVRVFYPGRQVRLAYTYNIKISISYLVRITSFEITPARLLFERVPALAEVYPDLPPDDEIAAIGIALGL